MWRIQVIIEYKRLLKRERFITKWGNEGVQNGQFRSLHQVAVDPSGKYVYTIEIDNYREKFTSDGKFIGKWGYEKAATGLWSGLIK